MTLHNLNDHISWLLQHKQTPHARQTGSLGRVSVNSGAAECLVQESTIVVRRSLETQQRRLTPPPTDNHPAHAFPEFARPTLPHTSGRAPPANEHRASNTGISESMAKLASAPRAPRASLLSRPQLATPVSSSHSSLSSVYAAKFREEDNRIKSRTTPSFQSQSNHSKVASTSNRDHLPDLVSTPNTCASNSEAIELLDLTGNSTTSSDDHASDGFGPQKRLWSPVAASRAEPVKRGKKRKSGEIAGGSQAGLSTSMARSATYNLRATPEPIDEFVDIDHFGVPDEPPPPYTSQGTPVQSKKRAVPVQESVEFPGSESSLEEEYIHMETIRHTETTIRKSVSRKRSGSSVRSPPKPGSLPNLSYEAKGATVSFQHTTPQKPRDAQHISPAKLHLSLPHRSISVSPSVQTSTPRKRSRKNIIEDSEDDLLEECSPQKPSPSKGAKSPGKGKGAPDFPATPSKQRPTTARKEPVAAKPLVETPKGKKEQVGVTQSTPASSYNQPVKSITKPAVAIETASLSSGTSTSTPNTPISGPVDLKKLVSAFVLDPARLGSIEIRLEADLLGLHARLNQLLDDGIMISADFIQERKAVKDQKDALATLVPLREKYLAAEAERDKIKKEIFYALEAENFDAMNERQFVLKAVTERLQEIEKEMGQVFQKCNITETDLDPPTITKQEKWKSVSLAAPIESHPSSGNIENTQVVYQTQRPTISHPSAGSFRNSTSGEAYTVNTRGSPARMPQPAGQHIPYTRPAIFEPFAANAGVKPNISAPRSHFDTYGGGSDIPDSDEEMFDEGDGVPDFATRFDDEFGDFSDSEEMLRLADTVDNQALQNRYSKRSPMRNGFQSSSMPVRTPKPIGTKSMYAVQPEHAELLKFPWSRDVIRTLKTVFGLTGFRANQLEAINATLAGEDAFVLMPTGGGKSLCYQLPAVVQSGKTRGVTVVVSPLISLMQDQVEHLNQLGIPAFFINGEVDAGHKAQVMDFLRQREPEEYVKLLYVTPEMVKKSAAIMNVFKDLYRRRKLARFVIDEAHCVSQWGHDFRPDYKAVGEVRQHFPEVPLIALTATATENVKIDVMHNLGITGCKVFSQSFNRPNLSYEVRPKQKAADVLESIIGLIRSKQYANKSGIIYTLSRANCEKMADDLCQRGIAAQHYHAGLKAEEKADIQKEWQVGRINVIVATIAFGMGIDKADVRFVIHHTLPKSLEGYYQETGRAGRDGKTSGCYLYYGYQDTRSLHSFIDKGEGGEEEKSRQRQMLNRMVQYCENRTDCRRVEVLAYFGERFTGECNKCDNCNSNVTFEVKDFSDMAQAAVNIVKELRRDNLTLIDCAKILLGHKISKETSVEPHSIEGWGAASGMVRGEVERILQRLVQENGLRERNEMNRRGFANSYLDVSYWDFCLRNDMLTRSYQLGPNCRDFSTGRLKLKLQVRSTPIGPKTKAKPAKKGIKSGTGVAGAADVDFGAQSTDVSSPVRSKQGRRRSRNRLIDDEAGEGAADRMRGDTIASDISGDDFEPVRDGTARRGPAAPRPRTLGPPITLDKQLANLSEEHRNIVYQFVEDAKPLEERIRNDRSLKRPIFNETQFRAMAINWTMNLEEMLSIKGINPDQVKKFGPRFIPLIRNYNAVYEAAQQSLHDDRDIDQNHANVIDLVSDNEEYGDVNLADFVVDDEEDEDYADDDLDNEPSKYFAEPPTTRSQNGSPVQRRMQPPPKPVQPLYPAKKSSQASSSGRSYPPKRNYTGSRGGASDARGGRRNSRSFSKARSTSGQQSQSRGVSKAKRPSKRSSNGTNNRTSNGSSAGSIMKQFARQDKKDGGGGFGGGAKPGGGFSAAFAPMPT